MANNYKNPVLKKGYHKVTSPFGTRTLWGKVQTHKGIDLVGKNSTLDDIIAIEDGVVTISKYSSSAGEYIQIDHGNGVFTRYLHMKKNSRKVSVGAKVKKGQVLGYMGATGQVTGAHLHFDITINGEYVDPAPYLEGTKTLPINVKTNPRISVLEWQKAAIADGFKFPNYGADGKWGAECETVAKKAICKKQLIGYKNKNLTRLIQSFVGVKVDGLYGSATKEAVKKWQKANGLTADGIVGINSWKKIIKIK